MNNCISDERLKNICKIGQGNECCRYILGGNNGFECGKHSKLKKEIDDRVNSNFMIAKGDNCEGLK